jgi:hypothetical protein
MIPVASLLNPTPPPDGRVTHCSSRYTTGILPPTLQSKKPKMSKDVITPAKGKIKGEVRYPPHEKHCEDVKKKLREFQVHPMTGIANFCKHIPYNSEKKSFLEKTGREGFEGSATSSSVLEGKRTDLSIDSLPVYLQGAER